MTWFADSARQASQGINQIDKTAISRLTKFDRAGWRQQSLTLGLPNLRHPASQVVLRLVNPYSGQLLILKS